MAPLKITPPFSYSYQCGSTLLVSYIPVYLYSVSLQLVSIFVVASSTFSFLPEGWLIKWISPIGWPLSLISKLNTLSSNPSSRLISLHQIISNVVSNMILLLSFGLCSPVLAGYIALSTLVTTWCWLILVGRFVSCRLAVNHSLTANATSTTNSLHPEENPMSVLCSYQIDDNKERGTQDESCTQSVDKSFQQSEDGFLILLNQQLSGVSSLIVCKWPIISTSCFFMTLLCWEMVGDKLGWKAGFWVPVVGVFILLIVWIWDRFLVFHAIDLAKHHTILTLFFSSPHLPSPSSDALSSQCVEMAESSLE
jgi:hypothetical protein